MPSPAESEDEMRWPDLSQTWQRVTFGGSLTCLAVIAVAIVGGVCGWQKLPVYITGCVGVAGFVLAWIIGPLLWAFSLRRKLADVTDQMLKLHNHYREQMENLKERLDAATGFDNRDKA